VGHRVDAEAAPAIERFSVARSLTSVDA